MNRKKDELARILQCPATGLNVSYLTTEELRSRIEGNQLPEALKSTIGGWLRADGRIFYPYKDGIIDLINGVEVLASPVKPITLFVHDLRTPLNSILTGIQLLKDPRLPDSQRANLLDRLEEAGLAQSQILEELGNYAKSLP